MTASPSDHLALQCGVLYLIFMVGVILCCLDEVYKNGVRIFHRAFQFRMILHSHKKRMAPEFDDLHQVALRVLSTGGHAGLFILFKIMVVELPAVAMSFVDDRISVYRRGDRAGFKLAGIGSEPHG